MSCGAVWEESVLKKSGIPAILLEASVIVNLEYKKQARTPVFQTGIAEAVFEMLGS